MIVDIGTTKYIIYAKVVVDGYVEKHDIIGAIFGQTEGLLGCDLDIRDLQKSGRIGRIDVELENINGKSYANLILPSSLDRLETAIIAATIETSDRVGPCLASIKVTHIEDIRVKKKEYIINRSKELLNSIVETTIDANEISEEIKEYVRSKEIKEYGKDNLPGGPNIVNSETIIIVEGRADVLNLLRCGIKNAIAVGGTSIPEYIKELSKKKITTIYTDGDRGGELILKEALQTCDIDYIARAPKGREVEELTKKEVIKYLRSKIPIEQYIQNISNGNIDEYNDEYIGKNIVKDEVLNTNLTIEKEILQNPDKDISENNIGYNEKENIGSNIENNDNIEYNKNQNLEYNHISIEKKEDVKTNLEKINININELIKKEPSEQNKYFKKLFEKLDNSNNVIILTNNGDIKTISLKDIDEIHKEDILIILFNTPITQKIADLFGEYNITLIGNGIEIIKKPANLKIFSYDVILD